MHAGHLIVFRGLVIVLSLALVGLAFVHRHPIGKTTVFLICELGLAISLALASIAISLLW